MELHKCKSNGFVFCAHCGYPIPKDQNIVEIKADYFTREQGTVNQRMIIRLSHFYTWLASDQTLLSFTKRKNPEDQYDLVEDNDYEELSKR